MKKLIFKMCLNYGKDIYFGPRKWYRSSSSFLIIMLVIEVQVHSHQWPGSWQAAHIADITPDLQVASTHDSHSPSISFTSFWAFLARAFH